MDAWQTLINVLVEIWTDDDIKNEKWKQHTEPPETSEKENGECFNEYEDQRKCS